MKLELNGINKHYGSKQVLFDVSYTFTPGICGILGENGAGKSTLLSLLTDVSRRDKRNGGEVLYDGTDILKLKKIYRERIGYMPQSIGYYGDFTARSFVEYVAGIKGVGRKEFETDYAELMEVLGLFKVQYERMDSLSGGCRQRVLLCCTLLGDPELLILDEPTVGLDPMERMAFKNYISLLSMEKIILFVTHILDDVDDIADEVIIMKDGRIVVGGRLEELKSNMIGKTSYISVPTYELDKYRRHYIVSSVRKGGEGTLRLKLLGDHFPPEAERTGEKVSLEDVYMYYSSTANNK